MADAALMARARRIAAVILVGCGADRGMDAATTAIHARETARARPSEALLRGSVVRRSPPHP